MLEEMIETVVEIAVDVAEAVIADKVKKKDEVERRDWNKRGEEYGN